MDIWALKGYSGLFGAVLGNTPDNSDLWKAFFFLMGNIISCHYLWKDTAKGHISDRTGYFCVATWLKRKGATWLAEVKQTYKSLLIDIEMLYAVMD